MEIGRKISLSPNVVLYLPWWRHEMETFSALLAICAGNSPVTGEFPAQRPVTWGLMFSLICAWINGWVNNGEAGDLWRHGAHYDVTVMAILLLAPRAHHPPSDSLRGTVCHLKDYNTIHSLASMARRRFTLCMKTSSNENIFPRQWPFVRGIHRSPVDSPYKSQ